MADPEEHDDPPTDTDGGVYFHTNAAYLEDNDG